MMPLRSLVCNGWPRSLRGLDGLVITSASLGMPLTYVAGAWASNCRIRKTCCLRDFVLTPYVVNGTQT